nr:uridine diphosphate-glycosyltransferases 42J1 [Glyphodes pyloalis]
MRSYLLTSAVLLLAIASTTNGLNILALFPYDGKSHFVVFKVLLHELARKGHNLTVVSHFPEHIPPPNYRDINLYIPPKQLTPEDSLKLHRSYWNIIEVGWFLATNGRKNCKILLANKEVQDLVNKKAKYDVILTEEFNSDCALGLAYKLGAPVVRLTSHVLMPWHYSRLGIPNNPAFVPFHFLEGGSNPTLFQRVETVIFDAYFKFLFYVVSQRSDQNTLAEYYDDIPPLEDLARNIKFLLVNHHFTLTGSRLFPSNVIEVGGYHVTQNPLTGDVKTFIDQADKGIVYISFGTTVRISNITVDKTEAIIGAIEELPYQFIWRWDKYVSFDKPPFSQLSERHLAVLNDKKKFYTGIWLPQVDILSHPKVLGFISHGGMGGTIEAIHHGVPILVTPVTGDQPANAASIEESGFGIQLPVNDMTKDNLVAGVKKILEPRFRAKVKRMSRAWHDRPLTPMQTAVYWIEYAARNGDLTFRTKAADVPLYQYLNLDIALVFIVFTIGLFFAIKACRPSKSTPNKQSSNNKKKRQ